MPKVRPLVSTEQYDLQRARAKITEQIDCDLHAAGITQKRLAELTGVSQSAITNQFTKKKITIDVYLGAQQLLGRI